MEIPLILAITDEYAKKYSEILDAHSNINLYALMLAVRRQEDGPPGLEFGVMAAKDTNLEEQARWAISTFIKNIKRWGKLEIIGAENYIASLGGRWAPIGAENDEGNLNRFWVENVKELYKKYAG